MAGLIGFKISEKEKFCILKEISNFLIQISFSWQTWTPLKMLRKKDYEKKQDKKQENHKFPDRELFSVGGTRMSGWWCWVQGRVGRTSGEISYFHFFSSIPLVRFLIFTFIFSLLIFILVMFLIFTFPLLKQFFLIKILRTSPTEILHILGLLWFNILFCWPMQV